MLIKDFMKPDEYLSFCDLMSEGSAETLAHKKSMDLVQDLWAKKQARFLQFLKVEQKREAKKNGGKAGPALPPVNKSNRGITPYRLLVAREFGDKEKQGHERKQSRKKEGWI